MTRKAMAVWLAVGVLAACTSSGGEVSSGAGGAFSGNSPAATSGSGGPAGETGKPCGKNGDCMSGLCLPIGGGKNVCTTPCTSSADCVPGWACKPLLGQPSDVCQCAISTEQCNGKDDDCNGVVDDEPAADQSCAPDGMGYGCKSGSCQCLLMCGATCVNPNVDPKNCGACGKKCAISCSGGACVHASQIALGTLHTCARMDDGSAKCWGDNTNGQLGDGSTQNKTSPTSVSGLSKAAEISLGQGTHTCARLSDGTAMCWGYNARGQLGDGTMQDKTTPTMVLGLSKVAQISIGAAHTCARITDGTVKCWGSNANGELGGPVQDTSKPAPVPGLSNVAEISVGGAHTCARITDGTVKCWGYNADGQLGNGMEDGKPTFSPPTPVLALSNVAQITLGQSHTCVRLTDATVKCWGRNSDHELGDGTLDSHSSPTSVPGLSNVADIALGTYDTCARLTDGTVKCWGGNIAGEFGDGTKGAKTTPTFVPDLSNVAAIAVCNFHTCARLGDGTVKCWGGNVQGQLGDGTTNERLVPTSVVW